MLCVVSILSVGVFSGCSNNTTTDSPDTPNIPPEEIANPVVGYWIGRSDDNTRFFHAKIKELNEFNWFPMDVFEVFTDGQVKEKEAALQEDKISGDYTLYGNLAVFEAFGEKYNYLAELKGDSLTVSGREYDTHYDKVNSKYIFERTTMTLEEYINSITND